ncbi:MAG TPA: class I SAM-dependent methyltransferase [Vicinamibacterales bacterium]|nr:class I SAM-dependent methyltransferase [Vicinamibacterales bacterium]
MQDADQTRLAREQVEADRAYNDALTAFDRAVADCRGRDLTHADFEVLSHALIILLQRITAFVDSKDRLVASGAADRVAQVARALDEVAELRTRVNVLQRGQQIDSRQAPRDSRPQTVESRLPVQPAASSDRAPADAVYLGFEDEFRGSDGSVAAKLQAYVPIFAGAADVVDLGCGRGEFLAALKAAGITGRGVDANAQMVAVARDRHLDVVEGDVLAFVDALADESIGGAIATQVVEHLEPAYLIRLISALARALRPGAPIVIETINPTCWLAFFSSYLRDFTHVNPIHPDTLQYLLRANGFEHVDIRYSAPVPNEMKMRTVDLPASILGSADPSVAAVVQLAHAVNTNATLLNSLLFGYQDYAAIGRRA